MVKTCINSINTITNGAQLQTQTNARIKDKQSESWVIFEQSWKILWRTYWDIEISTKKTNIPPIYPFWGWSIMIQGWSNFFPQDLRDIPDIHQYPLILGRYFWYIESLQKFDEIEKKGVVANLALINFSNSSKSKTK